MDEKLDHIGKLREAYKLWHETRGGSVTHWMDLMADDMTMKSINDGPPEMAFMKAKNGKTQAEEYFSGLAADWEMIHFTPTEFIADGDRVVVLSTVAFRYKKTGKVAESPKADVFRFRGGQIVEYFEYFEFFDTATALAATRPD